MKPPALPIRIVDVLLLAGLALCASTLRAEQNGTGAMMLQTAPVPVQTAAAQDLPVQSARAQSSPSPLTSPKYLPAQTSAAEPEQIVVGAGKTRLLDMPMNVSRVSLAAPEVAEAVPVSARTIMINGKAPGETSLVIWLKDGSRREYDVDVKVAPSRLETAREQLAGEFGGSVHLAVDNSAVYITGRVKDMFAAQRAEAIAGTLGRVIDLLKVEVPGPEMQVLLKVRFANVDRTKSRDLGLNLFGAPSGFPTTVTTGTFSPTRISSLAASGSSSSTSFSLSDALNLLFFDPHLQIGATLKDLEGRAVLEILAEPNVLAMNGKEASFVAGGEFPFPTLQGGGGGVGQVTVSFREFGVRIHFLPNITPRGTIKLHVTPEVSSLDYANALNVNGFTVPALNTRRVETDVELQSGQSFAIAGLLDNRVTESLSRMPGLSSIPMLGKLFTTKSISKTNSELLIIITPELVAPITEGTSLPDIPRPEPFMEGPGILTEAPRTPSTEVTGPGPVKPKRGEVSVQEMLKIQRDDQNTGGGSQPTNQSFLGNNPGVSQGGGMQGTGASVGGLAPNLGGAGSAVTGVPIGGGAAVPGATGADGSSVIRNGK